MDQTFDLACFAAHTSHNYILTFQGRYDRSNSLFPRQRRHALAENDQEYTCWVECVEWEVIRWGLTISART